LFLVLLSVGFLISRLAGDFFRVSSVGVSEQTQTAQVFVASEISGRENIAENRAGSFVLSATVSAVVTRVVDGDTVDVKIGSTTERVRLLGINAPESVDPKKSAECFGKEAGEEMKSLLPSGTEVELLPDETQSDKDKYGRILRYVFSKNNGDVGLKMIRLGFAREYTFKTPYEKQQEYKNAEMIAKSADLGLWSVCEK
jgi:micrococcal nuclease